MRTDNTRYIGINQRVPIQVLGNALIYLLRGDLHIREEIRRDLSEHFNGQNRLKKAVQYVNRILFLSGTAKKFATSFDLDTYTHLPESDKRAVMLSLLASAYPFVFDLTSNIMTILQAQPLVNTAYIQEKMSAKYGSNRTMFVGINAVVPMLIELNVVKRPKVGFYERIEKQQIHSQLVKELFIHTELSVTNSKSILLTDISTNPWFSCFDFGLIDVGQLKMLSSSESGYRGGVLLGRME
jgi:hypothetical protein